MFSLDSLSRFPVVHSFAFEKFYIEVEKDIVFKMLGNAHQEDAFMES